MCPVKGRNSDQACSSKLEWLNDGWVSVGRDTDARGGLWWPRDGSGTMTSLGCTEFFDWDVTGMPGVDSDVLWTPSRPRDVSGTMASLGCADFCEVPCVCTPPVQLDVPGAGSRGMAPVQQPPHIRASQACAPPQIEGHLWDILVEHPCDVTPIHPTAVLEVFQGCLIKEFTSAWFLACGVSELVPRWHCTIFLA
jgi:hypothetical protein